MIGSAIAGGGSVLLSCSVMAPFGVFFILPLNSNPIGFVVSVVLGVTVAVVILGVTKKEMDESEIEKVEAEIIS